MNTQFIGSAIKTIRDLIVPSGFYLSTKGHCPICNNKVSFSTTKPWLRDSLACPKCYAIPRERALMLVLEKYYPNWRELKIHESSPCHRGVSKRLKDECKNYSSSQFFPGQKPGEIIQGFRNENLEHTTFEDGAFDLIITQDVMEHIYHPEMAFKEINRILKSVISEGRQGAHIFTVPIVNKHHKTERWAKLGANGVPDFLHEPEYHGNPVDNSGSPVTMHWGYDIKDFIDSNGNFETSIEYIFDLDQGIWAEYNEVIVSKKIAAK